MPLTADRNTPRREPNYVDVPVKGGQKLYGGALVMLDSSGRALAGAAATGQRALGRAEGLFDNTNGSDGDVTAHVERGVFRWGNSLSGDLLAQSDIGSTCYIVDDATVAKTDGSSTRSPAGLVIDVDAQGVWVLMGFVAGPLSGSMATANNLSDVANKSTSRNNLGVYQKQSAPTLTVGTEGSNIINVGVQLKDSAGSNLAARNSLRCYISTDVNGDNLCATAPNGGVLAGSTGELHPLIANKEFALVTNATGHVDVSITETATPTFYLVVVMPDGSLAVSGAITFA